VRRLGGLVDGEDDDFDSGRMLTESEVANLLECSLPTLRRERRRGRIARHRISKRVIRYRRADVEVYGSTISRARSNRKIYTAGLTREILFASKRSWFSTRDSRRTNAFRR
jgi:Helix-turn-helix domain